MADQLATQQNARVKHSVDDDMGVLDYDGPFAPTGPTSRRRTRRAATATPSPTEVQRLEGVARAASVLISIICGREGFNVLWEGRLATLKRIAAGVDEFRDTILSENDVIHETFAGRSRLLDAAKDVSIFIQSEVASTQREAKSHARTLRRSFDQAVALLCTELPQLLSLNPEPVLRLSRSSDVARFLGLSFLIDTDGVSAAASGITDRRLAKRADRAVSFL